MHSPAELCLRTFKRPGRYLLGARRLVHRYKWQAVPAPFLVCGRAAEATGRVAYDIMRHTPRGAVHVSETQ